MVRRFEANGIKKALTLIAILATPQASLAVGAVENTTIAEVSIYKQFGNFVFIRTAGTLVTPASCSVNGYWHFTLSLSNPGDRELYAMVLSAFHAGSTVTVVGMDTCNEFASIESMRSINVLR